MTKDFIYYCVVLKILLMCTSVFSTLIQMKSVRVGRSNRRIRVEGEDCEDWMAVDMGG